MELGATQFISFSGKNTHMCKSVSSLGASQVVLVVKNPPLSAGNIRDVGSVPGSGRPLEEDMATQPSIIAWRIPRREESGGLQPVGSHRDGHDRRS